MRLVLRGLYRYLCVRCFTTPRGCHQGSGSAPRLPVTTSGGMCAYAQGRDPPHVERGAAGTCFNFHFGGGGALPPGPLPPLPPPCSSKSPPPPLPRTPSPPPPPRSSKALGGGVHPPGAGGWRGRKHRPVPVCGTGLGPVPLPPPLPAPRPCPEPRPPALPIAPAALDFPLCAGRVPVPHQHAPP